MTLIMAMLLMERLSGVQGCMWMLHMLVTQPYTLCLHDTYNGNAAHA